jgi:hypothetical protein
MALRGPVIESSVLLASILNPIEPRAQEQIQGRKAAQMNFLDAIPGRM